MASIAAHGHSILLLMITLQASFLATTQVRLLPRGLPTDRAVAWFAGIRRKRKCDGAGRGGAGGQVETPSSRIFVLQLSFVRPGSLWFRYTVDAEDDADGLIFRVDSDDQPLGPFGRDLVSQQPEPREVHVRVCARMAHLQVDLLQGHVQDPASPATAMRGQRAHPLHRLQRHRLGRHLVS